MTSKSDVTTLEVGGKELATARVLAWLHGQSMGPFGQGLSEEEWWQFVLALRDGLRAPRWVVGGYTVGKCEPVADGGLVQFEVLTFPDDSPSCGADFVTVLASLSLATRGTTTPTRGTPVVIAGEWAGSGLCLLARKVVWGTTDVALLRDDQDAAEGANNMRSDQDVVILPATGPIRRVTTSGEPWPDEEPF